MAGSMRSATRAIQNIFLPRINHSAHDVGSVAIWTEGNQISSVALRTLQAMSYAAAASHIRVSYRGDHTFSAIFWASEVGIRTAK